MYKTAENYIKGQPVRFHTPGHKGRNILGLSLFELDLTEIHGMDNLHNPAGIIETAQNKVAEVWGADQSFFLVNGSSAGIMAAIMTVGGNILCARNSHISLYKGLMLSDAAPLYLMPEVLPHIGVCGAVNPAAIAEKLRANKVEAVYITSPTYEGFTSDIKSIADIVHESG